MIIYIIVKMPVIPQIEKKIFDITIICGSTWNPVIHQFFDFSSSPLQHPNQPN